MLHEKSCTLGNNSCTIIPYRDNGFLKSIHPEMKLKYTHGLRSCTKNKCGQLSLSPHLETEIVFLNQNGSSFTTRHSPHRYGKISGVNTRKHTKVVGPHTKYLLYL